MLQYWIWLTQNNELSSGNMHRLLDYFGSPDAIYAASQRELTTLRWLNPQELRTLNRRDLNDAEKLLDECYKKKIRLLSWQDSAYPSALRTIDNPPLLLYSRGALPNFETHPTIAVVGSRKTSAYGLQTANRLGYQIGKCGAVVVSGLAKGIDTQAMQGALIAGNPVVGVLGCGLDVVYPQENSGLYEQIPENGCLISEYPPGAEPLGWHFPLRNRIISGLSNGIVVVEAAEKSGALITARMALEQGRDVFAVPGQIDNEVCRGSNKLLREGAILAENGADIVREYLPLYPDTISLPIDGEADKILPPKASCRAEAAKACPEKAVDNREPIHYIDLKELKKTTSADEYLILETLQREEMQLDELIDATGLVAQRVLVALTMLEVAGHLLRLPGKRYRLKNSE